MSDSDFELRGLDRAGLAPYVTEEWRLKNYQAYLDSNRKLNPLPPKVDKKSRR